MQKLLQKLVLLSAPAAAFAANLQKPTPGSNPARDMQRTFLVTMFYNEITAQNDFLNVNLFTKKYTKILSNLLNLESSNFAQHIRLWGFCSGF